MQILLANAKIMYDRADTAPLSRPRFQAEADALALEMAACDTAQLADMLRCSPALAAQCWKRYQDYPSARRIPAIMAYNGQAYKHLQAQTLTTEDLQFAQRHLWITCFLHGLLRPLDGIAPYRMEHHVRLRATDGQPIDTYWKERLTAALLDSLRADDGVLLHLSTGEYESLFDWPRVCREARVVQPLFYVRQPDGRLRIQAVWAKACRGAMTRFAIRRRISAPEALHEFSYEGFTYAPGYGEAAFPHFIKEP